MLPATPHESIADTFAARGLVLLGADDLGLDPALHERIYQQEIEAFRARRMVSAASIPDVLSVLQAPGLVAACDTLLGPGWAIVPFTHTAPFASGAFDQHWHKDDNGPWNGRWQRHHHPVQIELLYYPQRVREDMGPTAVLPGSHYWTFNHETNQDNFAGADHLDFEYQLEGMESVPISGPRSSYEESSIREGSTEHDVRMRAAVDQLQWPLISPFELGPIEAGSVVLYSHNLFHRGNHRRDPFENWKQRPRFMWRFWLYRTSEPVCLDDPATSISGIDPLTGADLNTATAALRSTWNHHQKWLRGAGSSAPTVAGEAADLGQQLYRSGDPAEPQRVGAAYQLAELEDRGAAKAVLDTALQSARESTRRAATAGLIAMGSDATAVFLRACRSERRWIRRAGAFGLGDAGLPDGETATALGQLLASDTSVFVRSVAAHALGCLARRAVSAVDCEAALEICVSALLEALDRERNRLAMNLAQGRSIKFVRPTDDCDVCEGIGIRYEGTHFEPVRSAVRENALWSLVTISTHSKLLGVEQRRELDRALERVVTGDRNVFAHGLALDALTRLRGPAAMKDLLAGLPIASWETLLRSGVPDDQIRRSIEQRSAGAQPSEAMLRFDQV